MTKQTDCAHAESIGNIMDWHCLACDTRGFGWPRNEVEPPTWGKERASVLEKEAFEKVKANLIGSLQSNKFVVAAEVLSAPVYQIKITKDGKIIGGLKHKTLDSQTDAIKLMVRALLQEVLPDHELIERSLMDRLRAMKPVSRKPYAKHTEPKK